MSLVTIVISVISIKVKLSFNKTKRPGFGGAKLTITLLLLSKRAISFATYVLKPLFPCQSSTEILYTIKLLLKSNDLVFKNFLIVEFLIENI